MNEPAVNQDDESLVLPLILTNKNDLHRAYMPFITGGGLFVRTQKTYQMGEEVYLLLTLMDDIEKFPVSGKVVWLTPKGAQSGLPHGIGVQLTGDDGETIHKKIETFLAGYSNSERRTDTM